MPEDDVRAHVLPSQVKVPVFHPQLVTTVGVLLDREGRDVRCIEHFDLLNNYLYFARRDLQVFIASLSDNAFSPDHKLSPKFTGFHAKVCIGLHVKDQLGDTVPVAQVSKRHSPEVS